MRTFRKSHPAAPRGLFRSEAAGLRWLAEPGTVPVAEVLGVSDEHLELERLSAASPSPAAAHAFGAGLARLHDAGAPAFGWSPGEQAWFGPLDAPFPVPATSRATFTEFWVEDRLRPVSELAARYLDRSQRATVDEAVDAIATGAFDGIAGSMPEPPSRVHGDLWAGNIVWAVPGLAPDVNKRTGPHTGDGSGSDTGSDLGEPVGTLIDPAAHGGHRLEDLALLSLFGAPHLERIFAGYTSAHPLPRGWRDDLPAHLYFCLLAHVHLFGAAYAPRAEEVGRSIVDVVARRHPNGRDLAETRPS